MFEQHSSKPQRPSNPGPLPLTAGVISGSGATSSSRDQRLIQRTVSDLGKQRGPHVDIQPSLRDPASKLGSMQTVLELLGHSSSCARLARAGLVISCGCRLKPADDPAVAIRLAIHFARSAITHGIPLPASIAERLIQAAQAGDPACRSVAEWLADLGLLNVLPQPPAGWLGR